jgi:hypothetical protein
VFTEPLELPELPELPELAVEEVAEAEPPLAPAGGLLVVLLELPQPAITRTPAIAATRRPRYRGRRDTNAEPIQTSLIPRPVRLPSFIAVARLMGHAFHRQDR